MKRITVYATTTMAALLMGAVLTFSPGRAAGAGANASMGPAPMVVDERHQGATLDAQVGQCLLISLPDPWGGAYGWDMQEMSGDAGVLKQIGRSDHALGGWSSGRDTGQPDTAAFRLIAVKEGQATLTLICSPPPGIMAPVRLYQVTFNVQP